MKEILPVAASWMGLEGTMRSEVSEKQKNRCYLTSPVCRLQRIEAEGRMKVEGKGTGEVMFKGCNTSDSHDEWINIKTFINVT